MLRMNPYFHWSSQNISLDVLIVSWWLLPSLGTCSWLMIWYLSSASVCPNFFTGDLFNNWDGNSYLEMLGESYSGTCLGKNEGFQSAPSCPLIEVKTNAKNKATLKNTMRIQFTQTVNANSFVLVSFKQNVIPIESLNQFQGPRPNELFIQIQSLTDSDFVTDIKADYSDGFMVNSIPYSIQFQK